MLKLKTLQCACAHSKLVMNEIALLAKFIIHYTYRHFFFSEQYMLLLNVEQGKEGRGGKFEVRRICNMRTINGKEEFLVEWFQVGFIDSWEPTENLDCKDKIEKCYKRMQKRENNPRRRRAPDLFPNTDQEKQVAIRDGR